MKNINQLNKQKFNNSKNSTNQKLEIWQTQEILA